MDYLAEATACAKTLRQDGIWLQSKGMVNKGMTENIRKRARGQMVQVNRNHSSL